MANKTSVADVEHQNDRRERIISAVSNLRERSMFRRGPFVLTDEDLNAQNQINPDDFNAEFQIK